MKSFEPSLGLTLSAPVWSLNRLRPRLLTAAIMPVENFCPAVPESAFVLSEILPG
jgi:hypothetical protein